MVEEQHFTATNQQKFDFAGELICESSGSIEDPQSSEFSYLLQCFWIPGEASFVGAIAVSNGSGDFDYLVADRLDDYNDLESFYFVHSFSDAWYDCNQNRPKEPKMVKTAARLESLYLELAFKLMADLKPIIEAIEAGVEPRPIAKNMPIGFFNRVWSSLGSVVARS